MQKYQDGRLEREDLNRAVNPALNVDGDFYMLLDGDKKVVAYTEAAAPYFAGDTLAGLLDSLKAEGAGIAYNEISGKTALILGQRAAAGYVLAGRPMRVYTSVIFSFNNLNS